VCVWVWVWVCVGGGGRDDIGWEPGNTCARAKPNTSPAQPPAITAAAPPLQESLRETPAS
jgi:hypothetical protein